MKTIKMFLMALAITVSSVVSATTESIEKDPTSLKEKITKLLKNPSFIVEEDVQANVTLMFNKNCELVVLAVDSESELAESFIKNRLNYKKLDVDVQSLNKTFVVPVKIEME
jgi:hypothetical protein